MKRYIKIFISKASARILSITYARCIQEIPMNAVINKHWTLTCKTLWGAGKNLGTYWQGYDEWTEHNVN